MTAEDWNIIWQNALDHGHESEYVKQLRKYIESATAEAIAICRAWHGDKFAHPGYGGADFVEQRLREAQIAINVLASIKTQHLDNGDPDKSIKIPANASLMLYSPIVVKQRSPKQREKSNVNVRK